MRSGPLCAAPGSRLDGVCLIQPGSPTIHADMTEVENLAEICGQFHRRSSGTKFAVRAILEESNR